MHIKDGQTQLYEDKKAARILVDFTPKESKDISGTSVSKKGKFRGRVKMAVLNYGDFSASLQNTLATQGDFVLVADHTTPELLPLMKKSIAVVTNIGGLLSHAAIICRELEKPCIIGTKFATQILKDGDMVEVDADAGVVRKI